QATRQAMDYLTTHWFAGLLLAIAFALGVALLSVRRQRAAWPLSLVLPGVATLLMGLGGLVLPATGGAALLTVAALGVLVFLLVIVVLTGRWWAPLGYTVGGFLLLGLGGVGAGAVGAALREAAGALASVQFHQPQYLLFLLLVPWMVYLSFRSLAGLGPIRRWLAIGLRCLLITLLTLALAGAELRYRNERVTVFFVWDQSQSMPSDAEERIKKFISDAVQRRGPGHERDQS